MENIDHPQSTDISKSSETDNIKSVEESTSERFLNEEKLEETKSTNEIKGSDNSQPTTSLNLTGNNLSSRPVRIRREKYSRFKDSSPSVTSSLARRANNRLRSARFRGLQSGGVGTSSGRVTVSSKGRSRRSLSRAVPMKAAPSFATVCPKEWVFFKGDYYQIGDIVSFVDVSGDAYFAQIRGLLQDQYGEKSCVVSWLLPTLATPDPHKFDATTFVLGPDEEVPRALAAVKFVCHCPADYYRQLSAPYDTRISGEMECSPELGFLCTSLGHEVRTVPPPDKICLPVKVDSRDKT